MAVTPSSLLISVGEAVTPSRILISVAVEVTATSSLILGDVSVLSLTPHKLITTGQGGVILIDKLKYYKEAMKIKTFNRRKYMVSSFI